MSTDDMPSLAVSLETLRRLVEVGFERTSGQTALILQRLDQVDNRHAELATRVDEQDTRLAELERTAVTRNDLGARTRLIIAIVTVLLLVAGTVISLISLTRS
ncbi:hypothetical protein [Nonomuraea sp. SYSU D8015]|uniref:hypothetical protein n=1 Tax=Nonomuraea sp. SYSU D8015 TaxID=2593644 RepID=UPI001661661C|nr:hypothetical protein [Nonomuraea sp. SYSU D8015]